LIIWIIRYSARPTLLDDEESDALVATALVFVDHRVNSKRERPVGIGWQPRICYASVCGKHCLLGDSP